jgi:DNA polymerase (family X)
MTGNTANRLADLLQEIGQRTFLEGGNLYRAKAYLRAAENLRHLVEPLENVIQKGTLTSIAGVGEAIARRIEQLFRNGSDPALEAQRRQLPAGLLELLSVPGLSPSTILRLHKLIGIQSIEELESACRQGRLAQTKGLGAALERRILQSLAIAQSGRGGKHAHRAAEILARTGGELRRLRPELENLTVAGDLRRGCELIFDLRLVATNRAVKQASEERLGEVTLHVCPPEHYGAQLLAATGSPQHLAQLAALARSKDLTLSRDGLRKGRKLLPAPSEATVYQRLGLAFIAPELREGSDEIPRARRKRLPRLVCRADLHGLLHVHTDASDGADTLEAMAEAARQRGYQYLGISDHSQAASYAGGLSLAAIRAQLAKIDRLNRRAKGFQILKGIEADILADGSLDYTPDVLASFDFVVASVHSRFKLDRPAQTQRILAAIANPVTTILGHITGRQLLRRPGYDLDVVAILEACARHGVAVEINANPYRLELDWRWHRKALELGCFLSINPDAHSIDELDLVAWGIAIARKGGVPKERVLNAMSLRQIQAHFRRRRRVAGKRRMRL